MKRFDRLFLIGILFLVSCGGNDATTTTAEETTEPSEEIEEIEFEEEDPNEGAILTIMGVEDEVDGSFYMYVGGEIEDQSKVKEIHVIPEVYSEEDEYEYQEFMMGIASYNFEISEYIITSFYGEFVVYYDVAKTKEVCRYEMSGNRPHGVVTLRSIDDEIIIDRTYQYGKIKSSRIEPYAVMWNFNQESSRLKIEDLNAHRTTINDTLNVINLGPSAYTNNTDNSLYRLIEKESFKNEFMVNGSPYTGRLNGYFSLVRFPLVQYFELNFKNGYLHDTIKIYDDWGYEQLVEIFEMGELVETVVENTYEDGVAKPIIYLYPEKEQKINVKLDFEGSLTHTYPKYPEQGWTVEAKPDGTLTDENGRSYYALFWEGDADKNFHFHEGFVVPGNETASFFEKSLAVLGLTDKEANEFIVYWLPLMENNPYNLIHFSTHEYEEMAKLNITPTPDQIIRVMMVWSPLEQPVSIPPQNLAALNTSRKGFTVVEWGGRKQVYKTIQ